MSLGHYASPQLEAEAASMNGQEDGNQVSHAAEPVAVSDASTESDRADSDISMDSDTDDEDQGQNTNGITEPPAKSEADSLSTKPPQSTHEESSRKRKPPSDTTYESDQALESGPGQIKKVKTGHEAYAHGTQDPNHIPDQIWHHIFTFCPPRSLGRLLLVNKLFRSYISPFASPASQSPSAVTNGVLRPMAANTIWQVSRRLYWPSMPTPLKGKTELDMWRLACSPRCEHCGKENPQKRTAAPDTRHPGPGADGVATIWSFSTRTCGTCFLSKSVKELDVLLSSSIPSDLLPAVPFVFATDDLDVFSPKALENAQPLSTSAKITKRFWKADIEALRQEFSEVCALGSATVEEWLKGIEGRGLERRNDCARWEKLGSSGSIVHMQETLYPGYQPQGSLSKSTALAGDDASPAKLKARVDGSGQSTPTTSQDLPHNETTFSKRHPDVPWTLQLHPLPARPERTKEQVAGLKASRKAEIERRALLLDPPITPSVLAHMPSFQAAIQIITPLDENAWELLKPRLLAQRTDAEVRERDQAEQARLRRDAEQQRTREELAKSREMVDKDWEDIQEPVRRRIAILADEIIRDAWDEGLAVTKETCAKFAADVLLYVRHHFYAQVAKDATSARAAGKEPPADPPQGPYTQKLTLENMKWVFDTKIRPRTEPYRKELFLCNGCENTFKFFGFEGVIQHYAAKHTTGLSLGNVVVHWRAEWPETPPFSPEPHFTKHHQYQTQGIPPLTTPSPGLQQQYSHGTFPTGLPSIAPPPQTFQAGPTQGGPAPYADPYTPQPFPAPGNYGEAFAQATFPTPYNQYPPTSYHGGPAQLPSTYGPPIPTTTMPSNGATVGPPGHANYNYHPYQYPGHPEYAIPQVQPGTDHYRTRLSAMARDARELWGMSASFKGVPGAVRVHIVIHHLAKRFGAAFGEALPLTLFKDGLANNKDMRPVRNINELRCKACAIGLANAQAMELDKRSFSLPQLVNHFQTEHIELQINATAVTQHSGITDWTGNMVLLPDMSTLQGIRKSLGTDSQRSYLVVEALPQLFETPRSDHVLPQSASAWPAQQEHTSQVPSRSADNHDRFYATKKHPERSHGDQNHRSQPSNAHVPSLQYEQTSMVGHGSTGKALQQHVFEEPQGHDSNLGQRGDAGRTSSQTHINNAQPDRPSKSKKNKAAKKRKKQRNASEDRGTTRQKEAQAEEDKKAEEQERRQEEEIHAMWAADRAQAARVQSSAAPAEATEQSASKAPVFASAKTSKSNTPAAAVPKPRSSRNQQDLVPLHRQEIAADRDEPDLLGALEMHLGQERPAHIVTSRHLQQPSQVVYVDDGQDGGVARSGRQSAQVPVEYTEQRLGTARGRSRSPPVYARPPTQAFSHDYRERSPPLYAEPFYRAREALPAQDDVQYERLPPRQEYYRVYNDEVRPRPVEYEAYELIEVRHPDGNYYIRRPVRTVVPESRPEPEPARYYARYEDDVDVRPIRREVSAYPPQQRYEQVTYAREGGHAPVLYESRVAQPRGMESISRVDPEYYEEYDPHFPAATPSTGAAHRQVRYE